MSTHEVTQIGISKSQPDVNSPAEQRQAQGKLGYFIVVFSFVLVMVEIFKHSGPRKTLCLSMCPACLKC